MGTPQTPAEKVSYDFIKAEIYQGDTGHFPPTFYFLLSILSSHLQPDAISGVNRIEKRVRKEKAT